MTGHIYKKIKALFENAQFQSDTNSAHPSQSKDLNLGGKKKLDRKLKWNVWKVKAEFFDHYSTQM